MEHFVWGGLQRTEKEEYPFALYRIPDWKQNRESEDPDLKGKLHIWRIYDYPHIVLLYYSLYRIARDYPDMPLSQEAGVYLYRAARTADAMFTIPLELDGWSAYRTGLYNELVIEDVLRALKEEGMEEELRRLWRHWVRKVRYFALECTDVFGSEYPFDTTGFESTEALAAGPWSWPRRRNGRPISTRRSASARLRIFWRPRCAAIWPVVGSWSLPITGTAVITGAPTPDTP